MADGTQRERLTRILEKVTDAVNLLLQPVTPGEDLDPVISEIEAQFDRLDNPPSNSGGSTGGIS